MNSLDILRGQLKQAHDLLEFAMADISVEQLHHRHEGSTIQSIAAIYAHTVQGEDQLVHHGYLKDGPSLFEREGWEAKIGIPTGSGSVGDEAWLESVKSGNIDALREYAQRVYSATDEAIASLTEADLDRTVSFMGEMPLGAYLANILAWHAIQHGGEICALKGCQGGQGLPF